MLVRYIKAFLAYGRLRVATGLVLMLLAGLTDGVGLLMLIPFLEVVGLGDTQNHPSALSAFVQEGFHYLGLPFSLPVILGFFITLITLRALLIRQREILLTALKIGFTNHLRIQLYTAVAHANWLFLAQQRGSDINHTLNADLNRIGVGTHYLIGSTITILLALVHIGVAFSLSAAVTGIALLTAALLLMLMRPFIRQARALGAQWSAASRNVFGTVSEFLGGLKLAKSYAVEDQHLNAFAEAITRTEQQEIAFTRNRTLSQFIHQLGVALTLSGLLYIAAVTQQLPATELVVLVVIFARLLPMLSQLQQGYQHIVHMLPAFDSATTLQTQCEAAGEYKHTAASCNNVLSLQHRMQLQKLSFSYRNTPAQAPSKIVLKNINATIPACKTTAFVGPSGAGKSTLADLILGLLTPDSGKILIDGVALEAKNLSAWRHQLAYVPQETFLFHDTIRANLLWTRPEADEKQLWAVLRLAAAEHFVAALPQGMDTVIGDRGIRLSGGERQRLALARSLLRKPKFLVLDEATSALDNLHERHIQQAIDTLHGELTMVIIAHRLSTIRHADQIIVLEQGQISESGTWAALSSRRDSRLNLLRQGDLDSPIIG